MTDEEIEGIAITMSRPNSNPWGCGGLLLDFSKNDRACILMLASARARESAVQAHANGQPEQVEVLISLAQSIDTLASAFEDKGGLDHD
jgi:hypothetical protein